MVEATELITLARLERGCDVLGYDGSITVVENGLEKGERREDIEKRREETQKRSCIQTVPMSPPLSDHEIDIIEAQIKESRGL